MGVDEKLDGGTEDFLLHFGLSFLISFFHHSLFAYFFFFPWFALFVRSFGVNLNRHNTLHITLYTLNTGVFWKNSRKESLLLVHLDGHSVVNRERRASPLTGHNGQSANAGSKVLLFLPSFRRKVA